MSIVQDCLDLAQKYRTEFGDQTFFLMEIGTFFEVYALIKSDGTYMSIHSVARTPMVSNIAEFAKINDLVIAKKQSILHKLPVVMAGFGTAYADKYIQKMQDRRLKSLKFSPTPEQNDSQLQRLQFERNFWKCIEWTHGQNNKSRHLPLQ